MRAEREDSSDDRRDQSVDGSEAGWEGRGQDATVEFVRASRPLQRGCRTTDVNPWMGWNEMSEKERREGETERVKKRRVAGKETVESTTEKDGERKSDGEERRRSLVALSTRAPPSSTSAPKTPTLAAARRVAKGWWKTRERRESDRRGGN